MPIMAWQLTRMNSIKMRNFKCGKRKWVIPLDELSMDAKRMLKMQLREFINELGNIHKSSIEGKVNPAVVEMLERSFVAAYSIEAKSQDRFDTWN